MIHKTWLIRLIHYYELTPPEMTRKSLPFSHLHEMTVRIDILVTFGVPIGKSELKIKAGYYSIPSLNAMAS